MRLISSKALRGPNIYHHKPIILSKVQLGEWIEKGSHEIPHLPSRLLALLPGLANHKCSPGYEGGFVERLQRGTYPAHIAEHMALELSELAGFGVAFGKTRYAGNPGEYYIATRYKNEAGMLACHREAIRLLNAALNKEEISVEQVLQEITQAAKDSALGPTTRALYGAALARRIPVRRVGEGSLLEFGYGKRRRRLQTAVSDTTSLIAADIAQDKLLTKEILAQAFVPVPKGFLVKSEEHLNAVFEELCPPLVVKPVDGNHGNGVRVGINSLTEAQGAYRAAAQHSAKVLIEEMCEGADYRVLVVGGRFVAAAERRAPQVCGDGHSTLRELVGQLNLDPRRGEDHENVLTKVVLDEAAEKHLEKSSYKVDSIPAQGEIVVLRSNANLSSGGEAHDVTDEVSEEIRKLCERVTRLVGLDLCGIDLIAKNLSGDLKDCGVKVIEVNAGPGLRMHLSPSSGKSRNVADAVMEMLYPMNAPSRIPIAAITGTNGKTSVARMLAKILEAKDSKAVVGLTSTDGIFLGETQIAEGDTTGPISAATILHDPRVDAAVLEVARGGLMRGGLAYDWSDVGIITNIRPEHLGQDGLEDLEDIVMVKSLVAERVRPGGTLVLNADDEQSLGLKDRRAVDATSKKLVLYSVQEKNRDLMEHMLAGGDCVWVQDSWIYVQTNSQTLRLMHVEELPVAFGGLAKFAVSNALAACAGGLAMGALPEHLKVGLQNFLPSLDNRGRFNLYKVGRGYVILDYGHNPDALLAVGESLMELRGFRKTAILGLPGDRSDELLKASAISIAAYFEHVILRDDYDRRGRAVGEVPRLLAQSLRELAPRLSLDIVLDEREAIISKLTGLEEDELVVIFFDEFEKAMKALRNFDPIPQQQFFSKQRAGRAKAAGFAFGERRASH
jgi:cyanophycin synthetase